MDINSAFNGMNMNSMYHSRLHTQTYHAAVTSALTGAGNFGEVAIRLTAIRIQINMGAFPF
jgi:ACR3 family arsenite efflux pump ArsB